MIDKDKKMIYDNDPWLEPYRDAIDARHERILAERDRIAGEGRLADAANNHLYYGMHRCSDGSWIFREWAPHATKIYLIGEFNNWKRTEAYALKPLGGGNWEIRLDPMFLSHGELYKLYIEWPGGGGERLPAYTTRAVQDPDTKLFCAQVWAPDKPYRWKHKGPGKREHPLIYECHIGMSSEEPKVSTFNEFRQNVLPYVKDLGYDTLQIMALQEHPYYGSFGYQVSNFYALSSRFGTPEDFKALVDEAHKDGIAVVMDIVHSHSVDNELEGLSMFDGRDDLYFYSGDRGRHPAWGSRCFNYGKYETIGFLLSNCKFWMEEYHIDGFRFDGVTSMLYWDHGLGKSFAGYDNYFNGGVDESAVTYLALANMRGRPLDKVDKGAPGREVEHGRDVVAAHQQAGGREDDKLCGVPRPGSRRRQDHHIQAYGQGDVFPYGQEVVFSDSRQGYSTAQDDTSGDNGYSRRRLSYIHG